MFHAHDVICGRGKGAYLHPGNCVFRRLVILNKDLYASSKRKEKLKLTKSIVEVIKSQDPPGKFLEYDSHSDRWVEISHVKAIEKTKQALRNRLALDSKDTALEHQYNMNVNTQDMNTLSSSASMIQTRKEISFDDLKTSHTEKKIPYVTKGGTQPMKGEEFACALIEKSIEESCKDLGIAEQEIDALIFQTFSKHNVEKQCSKNIDKSESESESSMDESDDANNIEILK